MLGFSGRRMLKIVWSLGLSFLIEHEGLVTESASWIFEVRTLALFFF